MNLFWGYLYLTALASLTIYAVCVAAARADRISARKPQKP